LEGVRLSREVRIVPNETDLVIKIQSELEHDSLYNLINERDQLKKELFNKDFISILEEDFHRWYSVAEAGKVLGGDKPVPPSSLTYYIDSLNEYIVPEDAPSNKYIRLNYLSIVKLKMVLLLKDEFRLNGLKAELGITGNPKNVIKNNKTNLPSNELDFEEMNRKLERYEAMNEMLWSLLVEKGEDGTPQLKKPLQSLLNSEMVLLEGESSISKKLEEQNETIERLVGENKKLQERIQKTEEQTSSVDKKLEESLSEKKEKDEKERQRVLESQKKLNYLTDTLRARNQAEEEWEKQGFLKRLKGNRSEFVAERMKAIIKEIEEENIKAHQLKDEG